MAFRVQLAILSVSICLVPGMRQNVASLMEELHVDDNVTDSDELGYFDAEVGNDHNSSWKPTVPIIVPDGIAGPKVSPDAFVQADGDIVRAVADGDSYRLMTSQDSVSEPQRSTNQADPQLLMSNSTFLEMAALHSKALQNRMLSENMLTLPYNVPSVTSSAFSEIDAAHRPHVQDWKDGLSPYMRALKLPDKMDNKFFIGSGISLGLVIVACYLCCLGPDTKMASLEHKEASYEASREENDPAKTGDGSILSGGHPAHNASRIKENATWYYESRRPALTG